MWHHYFLTAFRNLRKRKLFSLIHVLGLSVGMAVCLLIIHYVQFEKSYDTFHQNSERIYRLRYERTSSEGKTVRFASCCPPAAPLIRTGYPDVEKIGRIFRYKASVSFGEIKFSEERMFFAEPDIFDILSFDVIEGDPAGGLSQPNRAFVSASTARRYFGEDSPVGKTIFVDKRTDYQVVGVFRDSPRNSHLKCDILLSFKNVESMYGPDVMRAWGHTGFFTYLRLKPGHDPAEFEKKLEPLVDREFGEVLKQYKMALNLRMQPLEDIHLNSNFMQEYEVNGNRHSVHFLFLIAVFIIVIAWVNYINLSTARSLERAREVGVRKVIGASRKQLVKQFFFETLLINTVATAAALILVEVTRGMFARITGTPDSFGTMQFGWYWGVVTVMFLAGVFLAGLYPVVALSSYRPIVVLKGKLGTVSKGLGLRRLLVIFQFVMSMLLLVGTMAVSRQISFMKGQDLGFDKDQILVLKAPRVRDETFNKTLESYRDTLLGYHQVKSFCVGTEVPGRQIYWDAGAIRKAGEDLSKGKNYQILGVDYNYVDVFDLKMVQGRNFSKEFPSDKKALMLNETAVKWMGFTDSASAVGKQVDYWGEIFTIVGVVKDYHQQSVKESFEPHIFRLMPQGRDVRGHFAMKVDSSDITATVGRIRELYHQFFPGNPFDYFFLDDYYDQQYRGDQLIAGVFGLFSFLGIFVTGLGILGLSSFMAIQRTKEVAVRKVLGASIPTILFLFTREFLFLVLISFLLMLPLSILGIQAWLQSFARQMSLSGGLFLLPLVIVALLTLLTIVAMVLKSATSNPVDSLRYE